MVKKIYCYVDESGQDAKSEIFVVVAIVNDSEQDKIRASLMNLEKETRINKLKWHKTSRVIGNLFLDEQLKRKILFGNIYFGRFAKPLPYFLPIIEVLVKAIELQRKTRYTCRIYIDGIDQKKARELTNALRVRGIRLSLVKSRRDESEPIIRLADRWAGYIRGLQFDKTAAKLFITAKKEQGIIDVIKNLP